MPIARTSGSLDSEGVGDNRVGGRVDRGCKVVPATDSVAEAG